MTLILFGILTISIVLPLVCFLGIIMRKPITPVYLLVLTVQIIGLFLIFYGMLGL
jgi:hypothetical protein